MEAQKFELKTRFLTAGRTTKALPETSRMRISLKFCDEGGEENLHSHTYEDQTYLVLDGEATFYDNDDNPTVVHRGEGILMPAGQLYKFSTTGDRPAVVLRIGGTVAESWDHYLDPEGKPLITDYSKITSVPVHDQFWTLDGVVVE